MSDSPASGSERDAYLARVIPGRIWQAAGSLGGGAEEAQLARASDLLADVLAAAARHGVRLEDFDCFTDLPQTCVTAIKTTDRQQAGAPQPGAR